MVDVNSYYKKILQWITTTTPIGIIVIVIYGLAVIPVLSDSIIVIVWALICGVGTSIFFVLLHYRHIHKELMRVDKYFRGEGERGVDMLRLLLAFPLRQPTIGFVIWAFCGALAALGSAIPSHGALAKTDMFLLWVGVLLGACTIWIFQFFQFRVILSPLVQEIVKKEPEILEKSGSEIPRFSIQLSQLITVAVLLVVSLLFSIISGYQQASFNLQTWIGKSSLDEVTSISVSIENLDFSNPGNLEIARTSLTPYMAPGKKMLYLVDSSQPKLDLLSGNRSPFNPVSLGIIKGLCARSQDKSGFTFDFYNNTVLCFKQISSLTDGKNPRTIYLVAAYPWKNYSSHLNRLVFFSLLIFLLFGGLTTVVAISVARNLSRPILDLSKATQRVAKGELREEIHYTSNDELGALAYNFRKMSESLKLIISRINSATESLDMAMSNIEQASKVVNSGAQDQEHSVEEVFAAMMQMNTTIQGISENVETLSQAAQESSSSIFEVATSMKRIFESIEMLDRSINDTSSSVSEMIATIDQVADNVNNLSAIADQTSSSMSEMNSAIRSIEGLANETAGISENVIKDAELGAQAVDSNRQGIHKVAEVVSHAEEVITKLGKRGVEIGKIVEVIEEVTSQTNLLALNAAIIAAQAGEHGRGFAVVADEIKQLAERTAGSTREITQLIRSVQKESTQAVSAIQEGTRSVADSVRLSDQARTALDKILESSRLSTDRVKEIARTTVEQASSSQQISKAMENMADMVNQISIATTEQSKGGTLIIKAAEQMKESSKLVHKTTEQQMEGARLISKSIENITDMLYSINAAQKEQRKAAEQVVRLMERIRQISQESVESGSRLEQVFKRLEEEAGKLKQEVSHFQT
jgi:methyl-accepting chemotaxis protein